MKVAHHDFMVSRELRSTCLQRNFVFTMTYKTEVRYARLVGEASGCWHVSLKYYRRLFKPERLRGPPDSEKNTSKISL
jgi:hypothetical protein